MTTVKVFRPVKNAKFWLVGEYLLQIIKGLHLTVKIFLQQFFKLEKTDTLEWPEEPAQYSERFKGIHYLTRREDGAIRCTACFLCSTVCPANCIHIEADESKNSAIEKFPFSFEIDLFRCVFCGYCQEVCPVDAIRLGQEYALVKAERTGFVYGKQELSARHTLSKKGIRSEKQENKKHPYHGELDFKKYKTLIE